MSWSARPACLYGEGRKQIRSETKRIVQKRHNYNDIIWPSFESRFGEINTFTCIKKHSVFLDSVRPISSLSSLYSSSVNILKLVKQGKASRGGRRPQPALMPY